MTTDASDFGIGGYLSQIVEGVEKPIAFVSHGLSHQEIRWSTIEKECYAIVYTLDKLNYLLGDRKFILKTDHKNLTYLDADANDKVKRWKIAIQRYDMILEYIKGPLNIVADGMSRLVQSNKCPVSHGIAMLREIDIMTYVLLMREINELAAAAEVQVLKQPDLNTLTDLNILKEFVVPHDKRELIAKVHNEFAGHAGVDRTFDRLVEMGYHWDYMREHVRYFIKRCPFCQKMSYLKTPIFTTPFTTAAYQPWERCNLDSIGPLTLTDGRVVHILVAIDCFTRWVEMWVLPDTEMKTVRLPLLQHFGRFGNPAQILTDNGSQFINGTVEELVKMIGLQHVTILAYSKEENSIVERINKEIMRHLRALVYEISENENIEELLPNVQKIINANRNASNQASPAELLFGNSITLNRGIFLPTTVLSDMNISLSGWASKMLRTQEALLKKAELVQRTKDELHIANADPRRSEFAIGSYVLVEYHKSILRKGPSNKFHTMLRGPFKVLRHIGSMYTMLDSNTKKELDAHISTLHPFHFQPEYVDPVDVARRDVLTSFVVDAVLEHAGDKTRRSTLDFLVSLTFLGYGEEHNLWLPYSEMRDNIKCHDYLRANGMANLIPKPKVLVPTPRDQNRAHASMIRGSPEAIAQSKTDKAREAAKSGIRRSPRTKS